MSLNYAGTDALKTDFTRTGKRNIRGAMSDGISTVKRFYNQNFQDDKKQEAIELFLGRYSIVQRSNADVQGENEVFTADRIQSEVVKISPWSLKQTPVILSYQSNRVVEYSIESKQQRVYRNPIQVEKSGDLMLLVVYDVSPAAKAYYFADANVREYFYFRMTREIIESSDDCEKLNVSLCDWNLDGQQHIPNLELLLSPGYDCYVVGVQQCKYQAPGDVWMNSRWHWTYAAQRHLGAEFTLFATSTFGDTVTLGFVRSRLLAYLSGVHITQLVYLPNKADKKNRFRQTIVSKLKIEKDTEKAVKERVGSALIFKFHDTRLCVANSSFNLSSKRESWSVALSGSDYTEFSHVFIVGQIP